MQLALTRAKSFPVEWNEKRTDKPWSYRVQTKPLYLGLLKFAQFVCMHNGKNTTREENSIEISNVDEMATIFGEVKLFKRGVIEMLVSYDEQIIASELS